MDVLSKNRMSSPDNTPQTKHGDIRKVKKPQIEKKRRDRINQSLVHLKHILLAIIKQHGGTQTSKLDKADILEMTVDTLTLMARGSSAFTPSDKVQYQAGYQACLLQSRQFLDLGGDIPISSPGSYMTCTYTDSMLTPGQNGNPSQHQVRPLTITIPRVPEYYREPDHVSTTQFIYNGVTGQQEQYNTENGHVTAEISPTSSPPSSPCNSGVWRPW